EELGVIASVMGRFYAMDRGQHWNQTQAAIDTMVKGEGEIFASAEEAVARRCEMGITDEMIPRTVINYEDLNYRTRRKNGDALILFKFRKERMVHLLKMLWQQAKGVMIVTMTLYDPSIPVAAAVGPMEIRDCLGEIISKQGWKPFRAAESQQYAPV